MATITAANSILLMSVRGLFPVPVRIQGFSADDAFSSEAVALAEVQMGVDGRMSGGYVPVVTPFMVSLQADSPSNDFFDALLQAQRAQREVYVVDAIVTLPSITKSFALTYGILTNGQMFPSVRRVLQPRQFTFSFESVTAAPI